MYISVGQYPVTLGVDKILLGAQKIVLRTEARLGLPDIFLTRTHREQSIRHCFARLIGPLESSRRSRVHDVLWAQSFISYFMIPYTKSDPLFRTGCALAMYRNTGQDCKSMPVPSIGGGSFLRVHGGLVPSAAKFWSVVFANSRSQIMRTGSLSMSTY